MVERLAISIRGVEGGGETAVGQCDPPLVAVGLTQRQGLLVDLDGLVGFRPEGV